MKSRRFWSPAEIVLLLIFGTMMLHPALIAAGVNAYMKIGDIKGESTDQDHKDWIIIESMIGVIGSRAASAAAVPGDVTITKAIDRSSPQLAESMTKGISFAEVIIDTPRTDGKPGYFTYILKNVKIISKIAGPRANSETIKLAYESRQERSST